MSRTRLCFSAMATFSMVALPSLAQAGGGNAAFNITFGAAAAGSVNAVPVLSNTLLIALGLLLVVVAVRTLHANKGAQKFLSVALMAGGLAIGGFGVDRTIADPVPFVFGTVEGDLPCEDDAEVEYNPRDAGTVINNCDTPATVTPFIPEFSCYELNDDGDCGELASGDTCNLPTANSDACTPV
jgi:hypothetical protein